ncbi:MAG: hypothetical protein MK212_06050 [Saprospiraceae bacterium]|nr:hypothetical protein [Saprospiraceae bacterium]
MQKSEQLLLLIQSMSKSEKRHFKLAASFGKQSTIYFKIFDLLAQQKSYDKQELVALLEAENYKSSLARLQHYLYETILKKLTQYHAESYPYFQVMAWIQQYTVLRDRGLYDQGRQLLVKALNLAEDYQYDGLVHEILGLQEYWLLEEQNFNLVKSKSIAIREKQTENAARIRRIHQLRNDVHALRLFFLEHQFIRNKEHKVYLEQMLEDATQALENEPTALEKRYLYTKLVYTYYGLQNFEQLEQIEYKRLLLVEQNFHKAHLIPFFWYVYQRNYVWFLMLNGEFGELYKFLNEKTSFVLDLPVHSNFYRHKLEITFQVSRFYGEALRANFKQAYKQIPALANLYSATKGYWDIEVITRVVILFMYITFCLEKYQESDYWLRYLESEIPQHYLLPYQNIGKIAQLLIHDGLGNERFVKNCLEPTRIQLYRKQRFFEVANFFIKLFRRLLSTQDMDERKELLLNSRPKLVEISKQPEKRGFFLLFNFVDWVDSKLEGISIAELVEKRR